MPAAGAQAELREKGSRFLAIVEPVRDQDSYLLALVDGDSLTTFWGEGGFAGDDMYGKVEAESIERIEEHEGGVYMLHDSSGRVFRLVVNVNTEAEQAQKQTTVLKRLWRWLSA